MLCRNVLHLYFGKSYILLLSPSFTNRCTLYQSYKPLKFTLKLKLNLLLRVYVYDHHQGD